MKEENPTLFPKRRGLREGEGQGSGGRPCKGKDVSSIEEGGNTIPENKAVLSSRLKTHSQRTQPVAIASKTGRGVARVVREGRGLAGKRNSLEYSPTCLYLLLDIQKKKRPEGGQPKTELLSSKRKSGDQGRKNLFAVQGGAETKGSELQGGGEASALIIHRGPKPGIRRGGLLGVFATDQARNKRRGEQSGGGKSFLKGVEAARGQKHRS